MRQTPEKHTAYHELLEAFLEAKSCGLCELLARSVRRYLESLLYECVNDPKLRGKLKKSGGFCMRHALVLAGLGDSLGVAILYQDQLETLVDITKKMTATRRIMSRVIHKFRAPCPACEHLQKAESIRTGALLENLHDPGMANALRLSPGLCAPHFFATMDMTRDAQLRGFLIELHHAKYSALLGEVGDFIRKHDYHYSNEGYGAEGDSWKRAVRLFVGDL